MIVVNKRGWVGPRIECPHCRSLMTIDCDDIMYSSYENIFYVYCGYCTKSVAIAECTIPARIRDMIVQKVTGENNEQSAKV